MTNSPGMNRDSEAHPEP